MIEITKKLLSMRRELELEILEKIREFEEAAGLCVSSVRLRHQTFSTVYTCEEETVGVSVEVLL